MSRMLLLVALVGCAKAGPAEIGGGRDGGGTHPDGHNIDSFVNTADAPPGQQQMTLGQTTSGTIASFASIACGNQYLTQANNFYRVFDPSTYGITTDFHVTQVSFQVEDCESAGGNGLVVQVQVGKYTGTPPTTAGGTLSLGSMVVLQTDSNVQVPEVDEIDTTPGGTVNVAMNTTIPAGNKVFVEVDAPAGGVFEYFYIGANAGGQSALGFFSAPGGQCSPPGATPTDISSVAGHEVDLLMTVTGTY